MLQTTYRDARVIDGVVITFTDITRSKHLEAELKEAQALLERRLDEQALQLGHATSELRAEQARHGARAPAAKRPRKPRI